MISNSLDWPPVERHLIRQSIKLSNRNDLISMIRNINDEIVELSRAEVEARRGKKHKAASMLTKVNEDIRLVEEYVLIAALIG